MLSTCLGGVVCVCCIVVGRFARLRYQKRVDVMGDLVSLVAYIEERIRYDMASLPQICASFADMHLTSQVGAACRGYPDVTDVDLPHDEWRQVKELLLGLGRSDVEGQAGRIAYVRSQMEAMRANAERDMVKKGNVYAKLWIVLGIALMIWMV